MEPKASYASNNHPIIAKHYAISSLERYIKNEEQRFSIIDKQVYNLLIDKLEASAQKFDAKCVVIPPGETSKPFEHHHHTTEYLLSYQLTRQICIVAIGGGATGDFAEFVVATLLRGVSFVRVPTTILAHDPSVGGKVGINSEHGKNLIGAFYRPRTVIYDLNFLETLPYSEILSGYAEVYKHTLLDGEKSTKDVESNFTSNKVLQVLKDLDYYLLEGIKTKLNIVVEDEKGKGKRKFLNLGHTFDHTTEYEHKILHGHAVMIGILYQFVVTNHLFKTNYDIQHCTNYTKKLRYPLSTVKQLHFEDTCHFMLLDKKNNYNGIQMVLPKNLGKPVAAHVDKDTLLSAFKKLQSCFK